MSGDLYDGIVTANQLSALVWRERLIQSRRENRSNV